MTWSCDEALDVPVTVCTAHLRFVPCRKGSPCWPCVLSTEEEDVERVREFHSSRDGGEVT